MSEQNIAHFSPLQKGRRDGKLRTGYKLPNKTLPPRFLGAIVERTVLDQTLARVADGVWLLTAPPGYGKTALLARQYHRLAAQDAATGWLTLSGEDNDPATLLRNMIWAYAPHLSEPTDPQTDLWAGLAALRDSFGHHDRRHLFLDGLEAVTAPASRQILDTVLLGLPDHVTLYAAGRSASPFRFYEGRLRGLLRELSVDDLRLSDAEAGQILGPDWSRMDVEILNNLMQGWPAGVQFMALDPAAARAILDAPGADLRLPAGLAAYFEGEVCAAFDAETLTDMMEASAVTILSPEILANIPGRPCSWQRMAAILQNNMFVRAVESAERWFEFHPAFGQFLRQRLYCLQPRRFEELERFAADWFQGHGYPIEAMRHARQLRDGVHAATVMEKLGAFQVELREDAPFAGPQSISMDLAVEFPLVCLNQIYLLIRKGKHREARVAFDRMSARTRNFSAFPETTDLVVVHSFARMIQTILNVSDDLPVTQADIDDAERDLKRLIGVNPVLAGSVASLLSLCYIGLGRYEEASAVSDIGLNDLRDSRVIHISFFLYLQNAAASLALGRPKEAAFYNEAACRLAKSRMVHDKYEMLAAQTFRAELHYENNEIAALRDWMATVLDKFPTVNGWFELYAAAYGTASALAGITLGLDAAEPVFAAAEALAKQRNMPRLSRLSKILRLRETTRARELRKAAQLFEQVDFQAMIAPAASASTGWDERIRVPALLEAARLMIALGRFRDSAALLEQVNKAYLEEGDIRFRFTFRMLAMQTAFHLRRYNSAFDHLLAGLELGLRGSLIRRTLNHRLDILEVFDWSIHNGRSFPRRIQSFVDTALREASDDDTALALRYRSAAKRSGSSATTFVLSPRETEIIALIAEGYASKEIAYRLAISEGTVKTHRKKINEKLGVASRSQAIAKARDLLII